MNVVYDIVGVGVGPSNLALATAVAEHGGLKAKFFDEKHSFAWHPNMLIENAEMQVSFLKDIVTMRNPQSAYSFINYLFSKNRLAEFINLKHFYPSRIEYNDYLCWVANQLKNYIQFGVKVINIEPHGPKPYKIFKISYFDSVNNNAQIVFAKAVVIATGGSVKLPEFITPDMLGPTMCHSSNYLKTIKPFKDTPLLRRHLCVVGGGQSAAEIAYDLYRSFPTSRVSLIHRGFGLKSVDDSWFTNKIYDKETSEFLFDLEPEQRAEIIAEYRETNYAAIDLELIEKFGRIIYDEKVSGKHRLYINRFSSIIGVVAIDNRVRVEISNKTEPKKNHFLDVDALILSTGYHYANPPNILSSLNQYVKRNEQGQVCVSKEYRLVLDEEHVDAHIYTQGCNEGTHGLSDTLLSLAAIRAKIILDQIKNNFALDLCRENEVQYES